MLLKRKLTYATASCLLLGLCSIFIAFAEVDRVFPEYRNLFMWLKFVNGVAGLVLAIYFHFRATSDASLAVLFFVMIFYCLSSMWLVPMYEAAYFQCAIGCAFFDLKRKWLYPVSFGLGLAGILVTYRIQDAIGWKLPPVARLDWIWTSCIFFLVSLMIHQFYIKTNRREIEKNARFGLVGKESTRLLHDIKGLISSPLMLVESLNDKGSTLSTEDYALQLKTLTKDMQNIREVIKSINQLVLVDEKIIKIDIYSALNPALSVLERRLRDVRIETPTSKFVKGNQQGLQSVFFNLLLNSLEAFEQRKTPNPQIQIQWEGSALVFYDNAGRSDSEAKPHSTGLGLEMVKAELSKMGAFFEFEIHNECARAKIHFFS